MRIRDAARIVLSLAVFGAVLWYIDAPRFAAIVAGADPRWLAGALAASVVAMYCASHALAAVCHRQVSAGAVFRVNLISTYMSVFIPGDLAAGLLSRMRYLGLPSWQEVVQRTVVERLVGLGCFAFISGVSLFFSAYQAVWGWKSLVLPAGVLAAAAAGIAAMRHAPRILASRPWLRSIFSRLSPGTAMAPFAMTPEVVAWSLACQLCMGLVPYAILRALGHGIGYADAVVVTFVVVLAHLVPFFVAGIGIRDVSAVVMLGALQIPAEVAVAFSTLFLFIIVVLAAVGGLVQIRAEKAR